MKCRFTRTWTNQNTRFTCNSYICKIKVTCINFMTNVVLVEDSISTVVLPYSLDTINARFCVFHHISGCKLSEFERVTALKVYNWFANRRKEMKRRANIGEGLITCILSMPNICSQLWHVTPHWLLTSVFRQMWFVQNIEELLIFQSLKCGLSEQWWYLRTLEGAF